MLSGLCGSLAGTRMKLVGQVPCECVAVHWLRGWARRGTSVAFRRQVTSELGLTVRRGVREKSRCPGSWGQDLEGTVETSI